MAGLLKNKTASTAVRYAVGLMIVLILPLMPLRAQEAADSSAVNESQEDWGDAEMIELEAVQIEGEIAQPNVTITVSRQEPLFKEITLEHTPSESLIDFDIILKGIETFNPVRIEDWKDILERPRE